uniref:UPAR/Ly6 domain-containing protein n=1 Tax=Scophthalmus maximus TaxID=52904 RepID=A0A8D3BE06_SCOMX
MKPVILVLLVVLVVSHSEALRCYCGGRRQCSGNVETCRGSGYVCASVIFTSPEPSYFKGCYTSSGCQMLSHSSVSHGTCCSTELCNR